MSFVLDLKEQSEITFVERGLLNILYACNISSGANLPPFSMFYAVSRTDPQHPVLPSELFPFLGF
jgi:hypothetical protein